MFIIFVRKYNLFPRWIWEGLCFSRFALQAISHCFLLDYPLDILRIVGITLWEPFGALLRLTRTPGKLWRDIVASMASLAFMTRWGLGLLIWMLTTTPHFNSARKLCSHICFVSQTNLKCQEYFRVFSKVLKFLSLAQKLLIGYYSFVTFIKTGLSKFFCALHCENWHLRSLSGLFLVLVKNHKVSKELENLWKCSQDQFAASLWFINLSGVFSSNVRFRQHFAHCALLTTQQRAAAEPRFSTEQLQRCWSSKRFVLQFAGKLRLSKHELES